jgi:hypothetical protein
MGESNPFKEVFVFACYMKQSFTFQDLSDNRRKILKYNKVNLSGSEHRLQCCRRNLLIARKAGQFAIPLGELKLKLKNRGSIENFCYHLQLNTHQGLSSPTIPLSAQSNMVRRYL